MTNSSQHKVYEFEDFRLDASTRLLYRGGEQVELTPKAVETLIALVESDGEVIGKEELMQKIWADTIVEESNLSQYLHVLRKTLGETSDGKPYIETFKRRGYRFNGTVRVLKDTNGLSPSIEESENFEAEAANGQLTISNSRSRRVEQRGNVRAFSQAAAVNVERSDNIYSVSDWRRSPQADTPLTVVPPTRSKWFLPVFFVVLVVGLAGIVLGIYKFTTRGPGASSQSVPFSASEITRLTTTGSSKRVTISPDGLRRTHYRGPGRR